MKKFANRRAFVTGATGFVGSRLTQKLLSEGWEVCALVRPNSNLQQLHSVLPRIALVDFSAAGELTAAIADYSPDVVFHLASRFIAEHRSEQIPELIDSNIRFGTELVEALVNARIQKLINVGTSWQHFETSEYRPVCLYAATKQAFEAILDFYVEHGPLQVVTLKLFDTYGPGDPRPKLFAALKSARDSIVPVPFSAGEQLIDLVHIDDVIEAFMIAANRLIATDKPLKEAFAVSSGAPLTLRRIADMYALIKRQNLNIDWGARPYRAREVMIPWSSGLCLPGWSPKIKLAQGMEHLE